jgi:hypothetical protein
MYSRWSTAGGRRRPRRARRFRGRTNKWRVKQVRRRRTARHGTARAGAQSTPGGRSRGRPAPRDSWLRPEDTDRARGRPHTCPPTGHGRRSLPIPILWRAAGAPDAPAWRDPDDACARARSRRTALDVRLEECPWALRTSGHAGAMPRRHLEHAGQCSGGIWIGGSPQDVRCCC